MLETERSNAKKSGESREESCAEYADNVKEVEARHALEIEEFDAAAADAAAAAGSENASEKKDEEQEKKEKAKSRAQRRRERQRHGGRRRLLPWSWTLQLFLHRGPVRLCKRKEIEALEEMLKPKGFGIQDVRADGHYLFRAAYVKCAADAGSRRPTGKRMGTGV